MKEVDNMATDAQIRAKKKWAEKNKEKSTYTKYKSNCKTYINNYLIMEDLEEVKNWIIEKEKQLKSND